MDIDLSGMEIKVKCPNCEGRGKLVSSYYKAFDIKENDWKKKKNHIQCPMCEGEGTIRAIAEDVIYFDFEPEPMYNEGYL